MDKLSLILLAFAFVVFCFAAWRPEAEKGKFICIGLAFWVAAELFGGVFHILSGGH